MRRWMWMNLDVGVPCWDLGDLGQMSNEKYEPLVVLGKKGGMIKRDPVMWGDYFINHEMTGSQNFSQPVWLMASVRPDFLTVAQMAHIPRAVLRSWNPWVPWLLGLAAATSYMRPKWKVPRSHEKFVEHRKVGVIFWGASWNGTIFLGESSFMHML